jgi:hypothetical protein
MRQHAPNWWRRFDNMPQGVPWRQRMMRAAVERHRELQRIERRDPEQHAREIEQLKLEDEVLGLAPRIWRESSAEGGGGKGTEELKSELRQKLTRLADLRIQNREARLKRLADTLASEQRRLEAEKVKRDAVVERQYQDVLNRRLQQVFPGGGPGGPGGVPGERRGPRNGPPQPDGPDVLLGPPGERGGPREGGAPPPRDGERRGGPRDRDGGNRPPPPTPPTDQE